MIRGRIAAFSRRMPLLVARYLRATVSFPLRATRGPRAEEVYRQFSLGETRDHVDIFRDFTLTFEDGHVILVTGESGGGKSLLLNEFKNMYGEECVDVKDLGISRDEVLVDGLGASTENALYLLNMVGLGEASLFVRSYGELSDGQKFRYRLAKALACGKPVLLVDEFCSTLDRDTAKVVAYLAQKIVRKEGRTLVCATAHSDLLEDLNPDIVVRKPFGKPPTVEKRTPIGNQACSLLDDVNLEEGSYRDFTHLEAYHYRGFRPAVPKKVYRLAYHGETVGVIVYTYSYLSLKARSHVFGSSRYRAVAEVNRDILRIARVIVAPRFRGVGLGVKLVKETLPLCGAEVVETIAAMAVYNPFFEHAGMRLGYVYEANAKRLNSLSFLTGYGFNLERIHSYAYVKGLVEGLPETVFQEVQAKLAHVPTPRIHHSGLALKDALRQGTATRIRVASFIHQCSSAQVKSYYYYWLRSWLDGA